jgi:hypothetical protein
MPALLLTCGPLRIRHDYELWPEVELGDGDGSDPLRSCNRRTRQSDFALGAALPSSSLSPQQHPTVPGARADANDCLSGQTPIWMLSCGCGPAELPHRGQPHRLDRAGARFCKSRRHRGGARDPRSLGGPIWARWQQPSPPRFRRCSLRGSCGRLKIRPTLHCEADHSRRYRMEAKVRAMLAVFDVMRSGSRGGSSTSVSI